MNCERPVYAGTLLFQPQGKIVLKKSWQSKYCLLFNASKFGIERLETYDSFETYSKNNVVPRIYTLENCIKITQRDTNSFTIITKAWQLNISTQSATELHEWVNALQSVAFKDNYSSKAISQIEEDNDLYCSSQDGVFNVKLFETELSKKCNLSVKDYTLIISPTTIILKDSNETNKILYIWPYPYIRRYGYKEGKLTFEAGRKCASGEGSFQFEYHSKDIFRFLQYKMKAMKKILNGEPIIDDQQLIALSMEARSRSPLLAPLQAKSDSSFIQSISDYQSKNNSNQKLDKTKNSCEKKSKSDLKLDLIKTNKNNHVIVKNDIEKNLDDYDNVEERNEAWKTFGIDDVKHSENIVTLVENCQLKNQQTNQNTNLSPIKEATKVINLKLDTKNDYNSLMFFKPNKLKLINNGYAQLNVSETQSTEMNGYGHIRKCASGTENSELIDDNENLDSNKNEKKNLDNERFLNISLPGYGRIKKTNSPSTSSSQRTILDSLSSSNSLSGEVQHQVVNEAPYAVISRPRRV